MLLNHLLMLLYYSGTQGSQTRLGSYMMSCTTIYKRLHPWPADFADMPLFFYVVSLASASSFIILSSTFPLYILPPYTLFLTILSHWSKSESNYKSCPAEKGAITTTKTLPWFLHHSWQKETYASKSSVPFISWVTMFEKGALIRLFRWGSGFTRSLILHL